MYNRTELEHTIRAAGDIASDDEIIILGSMAILAQFPNAPEDILVSIEADIFPKNKPEMALVIDGCIGELSPFHQTYGYYAHGVGPGTTKNLPKGWEQRLVPVHNSNTRGVTGWCIEIHDLVLGKYVSGREKDLAFNASIISYGLVSKTLLLDRANFLEIADALKKKISQKINSEFSKTQAA